MCRRCRVGGCATTTMMTMRGLYLMCSLEYLVDVEEWLESVHFGFVAALAYIISRPPKYHTTALREARRDYSALLCTRFFYTALERANILFVLFCLMPSLSAVGMASIFTSYLGSVFLRSCCFLSSFIVSPLSSISHITSWIRDIG